MGKAFAILLKQRERQLEHALARIYLILSSVASESTLIKYKTLPCFTSQPLFAQYRWDTDVIDNYVNFILIICISE